LTTLDSPKPAEKVLAVINEKGPRNTVAEFLSTCGYDVEVAEEGADALSVLYEREPGIALVDIELPHMKGADLVTKALEADPNLAIVVITDMDDATSAALCLQRGALDYLTKPVDLDRLRSAVDRAARRRATEMQSQEISAWLKHELVERTRELERQRKKLEQVSIATLHALLNALEAKYPDFVGHSVRVADLSATIAAKLELNDDEIEAVRVAGRLHDIGRVGIRDSVLSKKGPLTPTEQSHVREQVVIGFQILSPLEHLGAIREYVKSHHEHWDGSGYPEGMKGEEIPLGARILCAAEIFDAITSHRPYQEPLSTERAMELMYRLAGATLDRRVVDALARAVKRHKTLIFVEGTAPPA
jgi:response regulator RpfG family c-di-GMP phosphodiesterase